MSQKRILLLFDVDGTLTLPRLPADPAMLSFLDKVRTNPQVSTGFVGGSDIVKICEQLGANCENCFDFSFSENGLVAKRNGKTIGSNSVLEHFGEEKLKKIINFALEYIAKLDIPVKRGTFVEFRTGMLNISPIGRNCSQQERIEFDEFDKQHHVREKMIEAFRERFGDAGITYSIGGQISFDLFPTGWDKTYCLRFVEDDDFDEIHFFGDKTYKGGNDYEIFESPKTIGHSVTSPEDTMAQVQAVLATL